MSVIVKKNSFLILVVNEDGSWVKCGSWKIRLINNILFNMLFYSVMINLVLWCIFLDFFLYFCY